MVVIVIYLLYLYGSTYVLTMKGCNFPCVMKTGRWKLTPQFSQLFYAFMCLLSVFYGSLGKSTVCNICIVKYVYLVWQVEVVNQNFFYFILKWQ